MSAVLSYAKGEDVPELLTETIGVTLARTTETFGANLALVDAADGRQWTYTEFRRDVRAAAAG
ncbi:MAG TPA: AMP-binding protein, partial [Gordonia sp. (in: high G+C Gram-positive bacteria)]|nr:AMP-binding protein [Gordonia sp. (in: high G+C Gram-positive bacteria)]